jgi:hypothetical protein
MPVVLGYSSEHPSRKNVYPKMKYPLKIIELLASSLIIGKTTMAESHIE